MNELLKKYFQGKNFDDLLGHSNLAPGEVKKIIVCIEKMLQDYASKITYTQIRNILQIVKIKEIEDNLIQFHLTIPKLAYIEARLSGDGRKLVTFIRELASSVDDSDDYKDFISTMDTIVAFHKLYA